MENNQWKNYFKRINMNQYLSKIGIENIEFWQLQMKMVIIQLI